MESCRTTQGTKSAREVSNEYMEAFIITEDDKERKINVKWNGEGELSKFSNLKVKSFLEDEAWQLIRMVLEMYLLFGSNQCIRLM